MLKRPFLLTVLALALLGGLAFGVMRLFALRFEHGDVYPPYSTLRADPLGAKAIHDAIAEVPGFEARRNFRPPGRLRNQQPVSLVYLGVDVDGAGEYDPLTQWTRADFRALETIVAQGARAVFTFALPELIQSRVPAAAPTTPKPAPLPKADKGAADEPLPEPEAAEKAAAPEVSDEVLELGDTVDLYDAAKRWGFTIERLVLPKDEMFERIAVRTRDAPDLEPQLTWHSPVSFRDVSTHWIVLYRCDGQPVIMERRYGDGSIVVSTDTYFLSNEGLRKARHPRLLARLFGPRTVVFDEEHHGVVEESNIAQLARRYRLHGVIAGIVFIAVLFVWKSAARFVPPRKPAEIEPGVVLGKDSEEGFIHLLRRSVPPAELIDVCVLEWKRAGDQQNRAKKSGHVDAVLASEQARSKRTRNPVMTYRTIAEGLATNRE